MTLGLKSLHDQNILHRDLKCANVFISADNVYKLGDLNVSKVLKTDFASTQTGTPYYASPEVWKDQPYGVKSDIWSLGCVIYEMAALQPPFKGHDLSSLYKKVCSGVFNRIPFQYSNDLHSVISSLLKLDPKKRPSVDELLSNPLISTHYKGGIDI
jgi:NIMA (never in mitosis gene a)-related kinase